MIEGQAMVMRKIPGDRKTSGSASALLPIEEAENRRATIASGVILTSRSRHDPRRTGDHRFSLSGCFKDEKEMVA
jgi:hypothetical protein